MNISCTVFCPLTDEDLEDLYQEYLKKEESKKSYKGKAWVDGIEKAFKDKI